jgi:hypothetical protein
VPSSRFIRRRRVAGMITATMVVAGVATAAQRVAFADSTVDAGLWSNCQLGSSASLSFAATKLTWLDSTNLTYRMTLSPDCGNNTSVAIVEDTPQSNDSPQVISFGSAGAGGTFSGSLAVTPLRTLSWSLRLRNTLGDKNLGAVGVEVDPPTGPPDGGQNVVVTDNSIAQRRNFVKAVNNPGTTVRIAGNVDLDLSGLDNVNVAPNVQILGDRSVNPQGPRLFTTTEPRNLFHVPARTGSYERVSGIRLQGGSSYDPFGNMGEEDSNGILVEKPNVEIDHNEIYLWRGAGVEVQDCDGCDSPSSLLNRPVPGDNRTTVWVHDNYIHHDQHPTGEFLGGHGGGYGVEVTHGGYVLVERNVFDYNRHSMTAGGQTGTGYLFYRNLILPNGGVNSRISNTHAIDAHGLNKDDDYQSGQAGEYFDIGYNTVWNIHGSAVKLRGLPTDSMQVNHNSFTHCGLWVSGPCGTPPALVQNISLLFESDNTVGVPVGGDARTGCDFDGDGVTDTFHATGATFWFESTRLAGRYVYLGQSTATGGRVQLADHNNDGLCDVTADGNLLLTDPAATVGPAVGTVPFLVTSTESDARGYITQAGLTVGTVTYTPSFGTPHVVIDQSPHWGYVKPAGWPVNLVVTVRAARVPSLLSVDQASATAAIENAGLTVGKISSNPDCASPGDVETQNPSAGAVVSVGTAVNITVSTCPPPTGGGGGGGDDGGPILPK